MRTIHAFEHKILDIGYQGENERTHVLFNLKHLIEEFGPGSVTLLVARPDETEASPVICQEMAPYDAGIYVWEITESDLAIRGTGEAQLAFTPDGTVIAKTFIWETKIDRSLSESENPPAPWAGWVAQVIAAAQAAVEAEIAVPETVRVALQEAKDSGEFDGTGIASISQNANYTLTIHLTDGTEYTTSPVRGEKGDKGDTGNGIASVQLNQNYTLTINFTDGTSWTTPVSIRGEKGDIGLTPDMQIGTVQTLSPGSSATASVTGTPEHPLLNLGIPQGQQGVKGDTGNGIASISLNQDYTLTINYTDGTHDTTPSIRGEKGDTGATPNISIGTVTTVSPTTPASATMTGTPENPVLNLNIPQGVPGEVTKAQLDTKAPVLIGEASGGIATVLDGADGMPFKSIIAEFLPIQAGSGDASPDNSRPISGLTGMTIWRGGKNLLKNNLQSGGHDGITWSVNADGSINLSGTATADITDLWLNLPGKAYRYPVAFGQVTLVCNGRAGYNPQFSTNDVRFQMDMYTRDGDTDTFVGTIQSGAATRTIEGRTILVSTARLWIKSGTVIPDGTVFYPQLEIGTAPSDYEPCKTDEYIITWQSEVGTVYGARLNPLTGKMYITWLLNTYDGSENWKLAASIASWFYIEDFAQNVAWTSLGTDFALSDEYKQQWAPAVANMESGRFGITIVGGKYRLVFKDTAYATVAEWKAHLAQNNLQLAYKLAEPIEVDLTPVEILTLFGVNNIWTGAGNVSVEAPLDTKSYIDRLTQPDNDMVADDNIPSGKYFSVNNKLYLSTAAIARGAAIIPGTNCNETSIPEALNALNQ